MAVGLGLCSRAVPLVRGNVLRSSQSSLLLSMRTVTGALRSHSSKAPYTVISEEEARTPTLQVDPFKRSEAFKRPISPHLSIYAPQVTSVLSIFHRITGAGIGVRGCSSYKCVCVSQYINVHANSHVWRGHCIWRLFSDVHWSH